MYAFSWREAFILPTITARSSVAGAILLFASWHFTMTARAETYNITISDGSFSPSAITAHRDQKVHINIKNHGTTIHNFILPAFYIYTPNLKPNESTYVEFTPDKTGVYPYFSDAGGKPEAGMVGKISVK